MKRRLAVMLPILLVLGMMLGGCGGLEDESWIAGTWTAQNVYVGENTEYMTLEDYAAKYGMELTSSWTFSDDGTCVYDYHRGDVDISGECGWNAEETEDGTYIYLDDFDDPFSLFVSENEDGSTTLLCTLNADEDPEVIAEYWKE